MNLNLYLLQICHVIISQLSYHTIKKKNMHKACSRIGQSIDDVNDSVKRTSHRISVRQRKAKKNDHTFAPFRLAPEALISGEVSSGAAGLGSGTVPLPTFCSAPRSLPATTDCSFSS